MFGAQTGKWDDFPPSLVPADKSRAEFLYKPDHGSLHKVKASPLFTVAFVTPHSPSLPPSTTGLFLCAGDFFSFAQLLWFFHHPQFLLLGDGYRLLPVKNKMTILFLFLLHSSRSACRNLEALICLCEISHQLTERIALWKLTNLNKCHSHNTVQSSYTLSLLFKTENLSIATFLLRGTSSSQFLHVFFIHS